MIRIEADRAGDSTKYEGRRNLDKGGSRGL